MKCKNHTELDFYELKEKPSQKELDDYYSKKYYQEPEAKNYHQDYTPTELNFFNEKLNQFFLQFRLSAMRARLNDFSISAVGKGLR